MVVVRARGRLGLGLEHKTHCHSGWQLYHGDTGGGTGSPTPSPSRPGSRPALGHQHQVEVTIIMMGHCGMHHDTYKGHPFQLRLLVGSSSST